MKKKVLPELRVGLLKRLVNDLGYKILYFDIETSPIEFYGWDTGEHYITYKQIKEGKETKVITIQYMFEEDTQPKVLIWDVIESKLFNLLPVIVKTCLLKYVSKKLLIKLGCLYFDDSKIIEEFITGVLRKYPQDKLLVIGQNHKSFDYRVLNERAKKLRLTPIIHNVIKIDTYRSSKQSFKLASHGLAYRSTQYGLGGKKETSIKTWTDILEGKTEPEDVMVPYGLKDVTDLRSVLWNDLPYYESLPAELESLLVIALQKCVLCEERKKPKFDITECKVSGKKGWECLNCGDQWV